MTSPRTVWAAAVLDEGADREAPTALRREQIVDHSEVVALELTQHAHHIGKLDALKGEKWRHISTKTHEIAQFKMGAGEDGGVPRRG